MDSYTPKPSDVLERFMRYAQIDSQSDPHNEDETPSTACQHDMARQLAAELAELGCAGAEATSNAYVTATLSASAGAEDTTGPRPHCPHRHRTRRTCRRCQAACRPLRGRSARRRRA